MPKSGFYLVIHSFTYTESGKWPAYPSFPKGFVRVHFCLILLPWVRGYQNSFACQHLILTWAAFGFKCALLSLLEVLLKRGRGGQCIACICSARCANLVSHPSTFFIPWLFPSTNNALSRQFQLAESGPDSCTASKSSLWLPATVGLKYSPYTPLVCCGCG